ncbi:MAG TPA: helix-turn-helix transcriptional regulator [Blastocatellia bacterium]|nr:helix-turn-helix transcriptional regulator [Blastocatellia bacterium]HMV84311.1 helix-turn-helix transcriptional regulator [Blastocatellia bacterium]HMX30459.1 helix-turn-helix transcriptional regulator [Blastocatellia bacterium]HMZ21339.1 helix-turn-helix transcriptional regulator [Blastocatellia bacterium]HNG34537.1 helix-turn-helix transcriptional regulator [Blastocatellia bacterium]
MTGQELIARRSALNLTPPQLAERLGVTAAAVSGWEREEAVCPYPQMLSLALDALEAREASYVEPLMRELRGRINKLNAIKGRLATQA